MIKTKKILTEDIRVYVETYGCSLNISDGEAICGLLKNAGFKLSEKPDDADCIIVNSCTVKNTTFINFKKTLNELKLSGKKFIITGCIPPLYSDDKILEGISFIGTRNISSITECVLSVMNNNPYRNLDEKDKDRLAFPTIRKNSIIEIIPVAQGCIGTCTYCQTRLARGKLKSYPVNQIISKINNSISDGVKEIWLTAQDSGAYGIDIGSNIINLLNEIKKIRKNFMLRLGMANPQHIKKHLNEFIKIFKDPRFFQFLHIPVQSGSNKILKEMNRFYTIDDLYLISEKILSAYPDFTFSTDIIVGFPGETDTDFDMTMKFLDKFRPATINRSKYSARPKTPAAQMMQISSKIISERSACLSQLVEKIVSGQNKKWIGRKENIIFDEIKKNDSFIGRNFAYKPVIIKKNLLDNKICLGENINVQIVDSTIYHLKAKPLMK